MLGEFTSLTTARRAIDIDLGAARRNLSRMHAAIHELANEAADDESVCLLSAEVDCQRRCLDALCRLDDEKAALLLRQRDECDVRMRRFLNNKAFGCADIAESLEELRQVEQRIRDLEDALLADAAAALAQSDASAAEKQRIEEEEKLLRAAVREREETVAALDMHLKMLSEKDASFHEKKQQQPQLADDHHHRHHPGGGSGGGPAHDLALKRGALKSKVERRAAVVNRLAAAADSVAPQLRAAQQQQSTGAASGTSLFFSPKGKGGGDSSNNNSDDDDPLASTIRSAPNLRRVMSLVKSTACHLREDFGEISSAISQISLAISERKADDNRTPGGKKIKKQEFSEWVQAELSRLLFDISQLSTSVLEEHYEDRANRVSVDALLVAIRRFCVFCDVVEPHVGQSALFHILRSADTFGLLPLLYSITTSCIEAREIIRKERI